MIINIICFIIFGFSFIAYCYRLGTANKNWMFNLFFAIFNFIGMLYSAHNIEIFI